MTNKEQYKAAFRVLQPETQHFTEVDDMKEQTNNRHGRRALVLCVAAVLLLGAAVGAYAADVGGIQGTLKTWFHGKEATVTVSERDDGGYDFAVTDENGETVASFGGGGVAMEKNGVERPLTPEEVLEGNELEVINNEEGRMMLYFRDRTYDITDLFNAKGICKVSLKDETRKLFKTVYVTVELEGEADDPFDAYGFSTSSLPRGGRSAYTALDD